MSSGTIYVFAGLQLMIRDGVDHALADCKIDIFTFICVSHLHCDIAELSRDRGEQRMRAASGEIIQPTIYVFVGLQLSIHDGLDYTLADNQREDGRLHHESRIWRPTKT